MTDKMCGNEICASCKKIRDNKGYWNQIESYIRSHSEAEFTHSICPECAKEQLDELKSKTPESWHDRFNDFYEAAFIQLGAQIMEAQKNK